MSFDNGDRFYESELFQYVEDPVIESVESGEISQNKVPKGIPAGGIRIYVVGRNLAYIQNPAMYVYYEQKMFFSVSHSLFYTISFVFLFLVSNYSNL